MNTFFIFPDESVSLFYPDKPIQNTNSGVDVFIHTDITIIPGTAGILIPLGIKVICVECILGIMNPRPYLLMPRSSIYKTGLSMANSVGLIDIDYRGELKVPVYNHTSEPIHIKKGTSLFQLVAPYYQPPKVVILNQHMSSHIDLWETIFKETARGEGGFGSTGNTHSEANITDGS